MPKKRIKREPIQNCSEKGQPHSYSNSFLHKFLLSLHSLHGLPCFHHGVGIDKIEHFMKRHYKLDGDVKSQVETAAEQSVYYGFAQRHKDKYLLVYPLARIQETEYDSVCRDREINYAKKIFCPSWQKNPTELHTQHQDKILTNTKRIKPKNIAQPRCNKSKSNSRQSQTEDCSFKKSEKTDDCMPPSGSSTACEELINMLKCITENFCNTEKDNRNASKRNKKPDAKSGSKKRRKSNISCESKCCECKRRH